MRAPGHPALGRGVVVMAHEEIPLEWAGSPVVVIDEASLSEPRQVVEELHAAWSERTPVVVALAIDPARFRVPESWSAEPWTLGPRFEAWTDRLHHLVWANKYDGRQPGQIVWWWAHKAERLGSRLPDPGEDVDGDVILPNGSPAWIDGGPRGSAARGQGDASAPALIQAPAAVIHVESVALGRLSVVPPPATPTATLAPDQLAAVAHGAGPARVIAPAGSGKTRVLTERLRHLLVARGFERESVLAVAYNRKARAEMEERCLSFQPRVRTINSLGLALLSEGRGRQPDVLAERDVRDIVGSLVPKPRRRLNTDPIAPYIEALSLVRLGLRDPEEVEDSRDDVPGLAAAFEPFRRLLAEQGSVDFDEQVYGAIEALLRDGDLRRRSQAGCRHLLVDEFQDLTPAHVLLLRLLSTPELDVFGVGDDDQVIYGHAGADPSFLVDYEGLFPGAADHPLEVNYRCPVGVVDAARHLLSYNDRRVQKEIRPGPDADVSQGALTVSLHPADRGASSLAELVARWLSEPGVAGTDVAVLTRVNSLLLAPQVALVEAGLPVDSVLRPSVLDRTGVRAALAYLRIGADPGDIDGADVVEVYRRPSRGFPQWFPKWIRGRTSLDRLARIADRIDDARVATKVTDLVRDLRRVSEVVRDGTAADGLAVVRDEIGLGRAMGLLDSSRAGEGGSSHLDDLEALVQVAALHPDPASFEPWLRAVLRRDPDHGGVTLSTIHRVKGQEWGRVAIFGVTAGLMPHRLAQDVEEERRVLHVALTRGRRRVAVLGDESRPSPFVAELDGSARRAASRRAPDVRSSPETRGDRAGTRRRSGEPDRLPEDARAVETALQRWRSERARRDGVPAYVVLNDKYLRGVAVASPRSLVALREQPGIGPTKLDLYGEEILAVIEESANPP